MKTKLLLFLMVILPSIVVAQNKTNNSLKYMIFGGHLGLSVNKNYVDLSVEPEVGVKPFSGLTFSLVPKYGFYQYFKPSDEEKDTRNSLGVGVNTRIDPIRMVLPQARFSAFAYGAFGYDHVWYKTAGNLSEDDIAKADVGFGIRFGSGGRGGINLLLYWTIWQQSRLYGVNDYTPDWIKGIPTFAVGFEI